MLCVNRCERALKSVEATICLHYNSRFGIFSYHSECPTHMVQPATLEDFKFAQENFHFGLKSELKTKKEEEKKIEQK